MLTITVPVIVIATAGIDLAMVVAAKGYDLIIAMPTVMSLDRKVMLFALGANLVLTRCDQGLNGVIAKAHELTEKIGESAYITGQFENPDNPKIHRETTGAEIYTQANGKIDILVGGVGTGGTIIFIIIKSSIFSH